MYRRVHSARTKSRENTLKRQRSDNEPRGSHLVLARGKKVDISSVIQVGEKKSSHKTFSFARNAEYKKKKSSNSRILVLVNSCSSSQKAATQTSPERSIH